MVGSLHAQTVMGVDVSGPRSIHQLSTNMLVYSACTDLLSYDVHSDSQRVLRDHEHPIVGMAVDRESGSILSIDSAQAGESFLRAWNFCNLESAPRRIPLRGSAVCLDCTAGCSAVAVVCELNEGEYCLSVFVPSSQGEELRAPEHVCLESIASVDLGPSDRPIAVRLSPFGDEVCVVHKKSVVFVRREESQWKRYKANLTTPYFHRHLSNFIDAVYFADSLHDDKQNCGDRDSGSERLACLVADSSGCVTTFSYGMHMPDNAGALDIDVFGEAKAEPKERTPWRTLKLGEGPDSGVCTLSAFQTASSDLVKLALSSTAQEVSMTSSLCAVNVLCVVFASGAVRLYDSQFRVLAWMSCPEGERAMTGCVDTSDGEETFYIVTQSRRIARIRRNSNPVSSHDGQALYVSSQDDQADDCFVAKRFMLGSSSTIDAFHMPLGVLGDHDLGDLGRSQGQAQVHVSVPVNFADGSMALVSHESGINHLRAASAKGQFHGGLSSQGGSASPNGSAGSPRRAVQPTVTCSSYSTFDGNYVAIGLSDGLISLYQVQDIGSSELGNRNTAHERGISVKSKLRLQGRPSHLTVGPGGREVFVSTEGSNQMSSYLCDQEVMKLTGRVGLGTTDGLKAMACGVSTVSAVTRDDDLLLIGSRPSGDASSASAGGSGNPLFVRVRRALRSDKYSIREERIQSLSEKSSESKCSRHLSVVENSLIQIDDLTVALLAVPSCIMFYGLRTGTSGLDTLVCLKKVVLRNLSGELKSIIGWSRGAAKLGLDSSRTGVSETPLASSSHQTSSPPLAASNVNSSFGLHHGMVVLTSRELVHLRRPESNVGTARSEPSASGLGTTASKLALAGSRLGTVVSRNSLSVSHPLCGRAAAAAASRGHGLLDHGTGEPSIGENSVNVWISYGHSLKSYSLQESCSLEVDSSELITASCTDSLPEALLPLVDIPSSSAKSLLTDPSGPGVSKTGHLWLKALSLAFDYERLQLAGEMDPKHRTLPEGVPISVVPNILHAMGCFPNWWQIEALCEELQHGDNSCNSATGGLVSIEQLFFVFANHLDLRLVPPRELCPKLTDEGQINERADEASLAQLADRAIIKSIATPVAASVADSASVTGSGVRVGRSLSLPDAEYEMNTGILSIGVANRGRASVGRSSQFLRSSAAGSLVGAGSQVGRSSAASSQVGVNRASNSGRQAARPQRSTGRQDGDFLTPAGKNTNEGVIAAVTSPVAHGEEPALAASPLAQEEYFPSSLQSGADVGVEARSRVSEALQALRVLKASVNIADRAVAALVASAADKAPLLTSDQSGRLDESERDLGILNDELQPAEVEETRATRSVSGPMAQNSLQGKVTATYAQSTVTGSFIAGPSASEKGGSVVGQNQPIPVRVSSVVERNRNQTSVKQLSIQDEQNAAIKLDSNAAIKLDSNAAYLEFVDTLSESPQSAVDVHGTSPRSTSTYRYDDRDPHMGNNDLPGSPEFLSSPNQSGGPAQSHRDGPMTLDGLMAREGPMTRDGPTTREGPMQARAVLASLAGARVDTKPSGGVSERMSVQGTLDQGINIVSAVNMSSAANMIPGANMSSTANLLGGSSTNLSGSAGANGGSLSRSGTTGCLPPLSPRARLSQLSSAAKLIETRLMPWKLFPCPDGRFYYGNTATSDSSWSLPDSVFTKAFGECAMVVANGQPPKYYSTSLQTVCYGDPKAITSVFHAALDAFVPFLELYEAASGSFDVADPSGRTPMHYACTTSFNVTEAVDFLIRRMTRPFAVDHSQSSPLSFACRYGNSNVVRLLLDNGAPATAVDSSGFTIIHEAASYGQTAVIYEVVKVLRKRNLLKAVILAKDSRGRSAEDVAREFGFHDTAAVLGDLKDEATAGLGNDWSLARLNLQRCCAPARRRGPLWV